MEIDCINQISEIKDRFKILTRSTDVGAKLNDTEIKECNQKCKTKYSNWSEEQLIQRILVVQEEKKIKFKDLLTEDRLRNSILKEGLLKELCTLECGRIESN